MYIRVIPNFTDQEGQSMKSPMAYLKKTFPIDSKK